MDVVVVVVSLDRTPLSLLWGWSRTGAPWVCRSLISTGYVFGSSGPPLTRVKCRKESSKSYSPVVSVESSSKSTRGSKTGLGGPTHGPLVQKTQFRCESGRPSKESRGSERCPTDTLRHSGRGEGRDRDGPLQSTLETRVLDHSVGVSTGTREVGGVSGGSPRDSGILV